MASDEFWKFAHAMVDAKVEITTGRQQLIGSAVNHLAESQTFALQWQRQGGLATTTGLRQYRGPQYDADGNQTASEVFVVDAETGNQLGADIAAHGREDSDLLSSLRELKKRGGELKATREGLAALRTWLSS